MKIIVALLKGGVGKTLTAIIIAWLLARRGRRVLFIDCDPGSQSAFDWHALALRRGEPLGFDVLPWASPDGMRDKIRALAPLYDDIIADAGGGAWEAAEMFKAAVAALGADEPAELIVPSRPNLGELRRIPATLKAAREVHALTGAQVYPQVLLVDAPTTTPVDEDNARAFLAAPGVDAATGQPLPAIPTMTARVRHSVRYPRQFGHQVDPGEYADVFAELFPDLADEAEAVEAAGVVA